MMIEIADSASAQAFIESENLHSLLLRKNAVAVVSRAETDAPLKATGTANSASCGTLHATDTSIKPHMLTVAAKAANITLRIGISLFTR